MKSNPLRPPPKGHPAADPGSEFESSGGYLEFVLRYAAKELFNVDLPGPLPYKQRRNPNWQEVTLEVDGKQVCGRGGGG